MKDMIRGIIIIYWFIFQRDKFDKLDWLVQTGYHLIDAFIIVYNRMY